MHKCGLNKMKWNSRQADPQSRNTSWKPANSDLVRTFVLVTLIEFLFESPINHVGEAIFLGSCIVKLSCSGGRGGIDLRVQLGDGLGGSEAEKKRHNDKQREEYPHWQYFIYQNSAFSFSFSFRFVLSRTNERTERIIFQLFCSFTRWCLSCGCCWLELRCDVSQMVVSG